jgi:PKD repeat protein
MPHRSRSLLLAALAATVAALAPAAAHATPPGANGPLFLNLKESNEFRMVDPDGGLDQAEPPVWAGGGMRGLMTSSPDGLHLGYFTSDDQRIAVSDIDGSHEHLLPGTDQAKDLVFSPDGTQIAFTAADKLWLVAVDGKSAPVRLGTTTLLAAESLDWAQDDSEIVVSAAGAGAQRDLYAVDPHTGATHPLTATSTVAEDEPTFAPDGSRLAFQVSDGSGPLRLDVMDADGSGRHTILTEPIDAPTWSPDGTRIAFLTEQPQVNESIASVTPDGGNRKLVALDDGVDLMWSIKQGTGNKLPVAGFTVAPAQPYTGGDTVLTSTATDPDGSIAAQAWDLDGDGQYDDATGPTAHVTFTTPGAHAVALRVRDERAGVATARQTLTVLQGGIPGAAFAVDPATPIVGQTATFTAAPNDDPRAQVVHHEWDFDGDGTFDADTGTARTVQHTYGAVGHVTAKLRVTDADGDRTTGTVSFDVRDEVRCGSERAGRLVLDGCLVVRGSRRIAPQGVTINGMTFGATPHAMLAIDVAAGRAVAVPTGVAEAFLRDGAALPDAAQTLPVSACGDDLGTAAPALTGFGGDHDLATHLSLADGKTFAGMRPTGVGAIEFGDASAKFSISGLFPRLLLNWGAEARGEYATTPDCATRKLTVRVGSFVSRIIRIPEIRLEWTGGNRFEGIADIRMADVFGFPQITANVVATDGHIRTASFHLDPGRLLSQNLSVSSADGSMRFDRGQEELELRTRMATTLQLFGSPFLGVQGLLRFSHDGLHIEGLVDLVGHQLGYGYLDVNPDLSIDAGVEADFRTGPVYLTGQADGFLDVKRQQAELYGTAKLGIDGIGHLGGELVISTKGIGACGDFGPLHPGFTQRWGMHLPDIFVKSCDFGDVRVPRATAAGAAVAGAKSVRLARGLRGAVLVAKGRPGHAPRVRVSGPGGVTITSRADGRASRNGTRWLVVSDARAGTTNVLLARPRGGRWTVRSLDGRALRSVGAANALPAVRVKARRAGKTLRWTLRRIAGQSVRFVELGAGDARRVLKTTTAARGHITYKKTKGARRIVAEVVQNGMLRTRVVVIRKV